MNSQLPNVTPGVSGGGDCRCGKLRLDDPDPDSDTGTTDYDVRCSGHRAASCIRPSHAVSTNAPHVTLCV